jgi:hypothetical protein
MDIQRGLPIVHINFLGYDEQSHRRGPDSKFAHWTLKGIDNAVKRLWHEATPMRTDDIMKCGSIPITARAGPHPISSCRATISRKPPMRCMPASMKACRLSQDRKRAPSEQTQRARLLGGSKPGSCSRWRHGSDESNDKVQVVGLGPVGFVYFPEPLEQAELARAAQALATRHKVPAVVISAEKSNCESGPQTGSSCCRNRPLSCSARIIRSSMSSVKIWKDCADIGMRET